MAHNDAIVTPTSSTAGRTESEILLAGERVFVASTASAGGRSAFNVCSLMVFSRDIYRRALVDARLMKR
jgi:hypothetical protein